MIWLYSIGEERHGEKRIELSREGYNPRALGASMPLHPISPAIRGLESASHGKPNVGSSRQDPG
jgi:hypothetical protein